MKRLTFFALLFFASSASYAQDTNPYNVPAGYAQPAYAQQPYGQATVAQNPYPSPANGYAQSNMSGPALYLPSNASTLPQGNPYGGGYAGPSPQPTPASNVSQSASVTTYPSTAPDDTAFPAEALEAQPDAPWYSPTQWFGWEYWDVSFEIGVNGTEGNSQSLSVQTGGDLTYESDTSKFDVELKYFRTNADGVESQNNGWWKSRYDWKLGESPWSVYTKSELYYDEFKPFDLRLVLNLGIGYNWIKTDVTTLATRLGAGVSREFGGVDDDWVPEGNGGIDFEHRLTKVQKVTATIDYYPEFGDLNSFRVVADLGWELAVDAEANLSLKLGILDQYDSTPNGAEENDINYTMLLIWKK